MKTSEEYILGLKGYDVEVYWDAAVDEIINNLHKIEKESVRGYDEVTGYLLHIIDNYFDKKDKNDKNLRRIVNEFKGDRILKIQQLLNV